MSQATIAPDYRHHAKVAIAGKLLNVGPAVLKWYEIAARGAEVPPAVRARAREFLAARASAGAAELSGHPGFVILHRCGESFYFLLLALWRESNELWEAVYYHDEASSGFAPFDPAYPPLGTMRPTFCVWELGVAAHESSAWIRFLSSERSPADAEHWRASLFNGEV